MPGSHRTRHPGRSHARGAARRHRHLSRAEAELLLAYLSRRLQERLLEVTGCAACQALVRELAQRPETPRRAPAGDVEAAHRVAAALDVLARPEGADGGHADAAATTALLAIPRATRAGRLRREARFRTPGVAWRVLQQARAAASPRRAEIYGLLAARILEALDPGAMPAEALGETAALAWGVVGRARWRRGDRRGVREALEHAERALVAAGWPEAHRGFRGALRVLRLVERRLEDATVAAAHALNCLLGPPPGAAPSAPGDPIERTPESAARGANAGAPPGALPKNGKES